MRKKISDVLNKVYGLTMLVAFFGGLLPLFPFVFAIIIGGSAGETISLFLYKQYYPWIIVLASISVVIGLINMYVAKQQGLSVKSIQTSDEKKEK